MALQYWSLFRQILLHFLDAPIGFSPNPLMRLLVNLRAWLLDCLIELEDVDGLQEAIDTIEQLFDTLLHGEPDELSIAPEGATSRMNEVEMFLEKARLDLGASRYQITMEEKCFLDLTEQGLEALRDKTTREWPKILERLAARAQRSESRTQQSVDVERDEAPTPELLVDLKANRVVYRGVEVPTRGAYNLQRQPLLALAVLARHANEVVTMAQLAEEMFELGGLRRKPIAPEAGEIRYRILRPFRKHLAGRDGFTREEMDDLVESVPGVGLKMNASSRVVH